MPSTPPSPETDAEIQGLARAIREAVDAELHELAANLASTDEAHLFGANANRAPGVAWGGPPPGGRGRPGLGRLGYRLWRCWRAWRPAPPAKPAAPDPEV
jgi:hypothetical protein